MHRKSQIWKLESLGENLKFFFCILLAEKLASQAAEKPLHKKKVEFNRPTKRMQELPIDPSKLPQSCCVEITNMEGTFHSESTETRGAFQQNDTITDQGLNKINSFVIDSFEGAFLSSPYVQLKLH